MDTTLCSLFFVLCKIRQFLSVKGMLQAYKSYVRPILEYCSSVFIGTSEQNNILIEKSQSLAIRIISYAPRMFSVTSARQKMDLDTLGTRRAHSFASLIRKVVYDDKASCFLKKLVKHSRSHDRNLRSRSKIIKPSYKTNYGKSSFLNLLHDFLRSKVIM